MKGAISILGEQRRYKREKGVLRRQIIQIQLMAENELRAMREYLSALETQNKAKSLEQSTLYREIDSLREQLSRMELYYFQSRDLSEQVSFLRGQLSKKACECDGLLIQIGDLKEETLISTENTLHSKQDVDERQQLRVELQLALLRQQQMKELQQKDRNMMRQFKSHNQELKKIIQIKETEVQELKQRLENSPSSTSYSLDNSHIEDLVNNYERLEQLSLQRETKIKQMESYIDELQYNLQSANNSLQTKEIQIRQLTIELQYLQKQNNYMREKESQAQLSRSHLTTPKWQGEERPKLFKTQRNSLLNFKENSQSFTNMAQQSQQKSRCESFSSSQTVSRLQRRNSILRKQNQMLLHNLS